MDLNKESIGSREAEMYSHIRQQVESGLSQRAYCEREGISRNTFSYWLRRYRDEQGSPRFIELPQGLERSSNHLEISVPGGIVIKIRLSC